MNLYTFYISLEDEKRPSRDIVFWKMPIGIMTEKRLGKGQKIQFDYFEAELWIRKNECPKKAKKLKNKRRKFQKKLLVKNYLIVDEWPDNVLFIRPIIEK